MKTYHVSERAENYEEYADSLAYLDQGDHNPDLDTVREWAAEVERAEADFYRNTDPWAV